MTAMLENRKCSAKTFWRPRKSLEIKGPAFQTVEERFDSEMLRSGFMVVPCVLSEHSKSLAEVLGPARRSFHPAVQFWLAVLSRELKAHP